MQLLVVGLFLILTIGLRNDTFKAAINVKEWAIEEHQGTVYIVKPTVRMMVHETIDEVWKQAERWLLPGSPAVADVYRQMTREKKGEPIVGR